MATSTLIADRVAFVTGGSRGIGAAIVRRLASDGARVAFTYSNSQLEAAKLASELEAMGARVLPIRADAANAEEVRSAVRKAIETFGQLDVLVCNAGILIPGLLDDYDLESFDRMLAVNVRSVFVATQSAARAMKRGSRIVVIGSIVADRVGIAGAGVYAMTKAAVAALVRGIARDLAPKGITVNTVQPGPTITDMKPSRWSPRRLRARIGSDRPNGRCR